LQEDHLELVGLLFRRINFNFRERVDHALASGGVALTFGQSSTLSIISSSPGINGAELARRAMVSPQAAHAVLRELVRRRLIQRRPHPTSLRADAWHLTARGVELRAQARGIFGAVMARMLGGLSEDDVHRLEQMLARCASALEEGEWQRPPTAAGQAAGKFRL
jgi:DNA-binding MarR family transcriptional regulator